MHILILNWRDIKNPKAGGAEVLTHEIAKHWVMAGHAVTLFTSSFSDALSNEIIDGVLIIRRGQWWNVHVIAFLHYILFLRTHLDVVVDEAHFYPFFSALYCRRKTVLLVCEVAHPIFFKIFPYPIALLERALEKLYLWIYRNVPVLAISPSTRTDLACEGLRPNDITLLPMGLTIPVKNRQNKHKDIVPTIVYLGRIHPLKGTGDAVMAFSLIKQSLRRSRFWIIGDGDVRYKKKIKQQVKDLAIINATRFFGFVEEKQKFELLSRAHILLVPSTHEGWGLTVAEAASQGTPAVAYNVHGLRDSVQHDKTGVVVSDNTPYALAREVLSLLSDTKRYARYSKQGKIMSGSLSWDNTAKIALSVIEKL